MNWKETIDEAYRKEKNIEYKRSDESEKRGCFAVLISSIVTEINKQIQKLTWNYHGYKVKRRQDVKGQFDRNVVTFHNYYVSFKNEQQSVQCSAINVIQDKQKQIDILQRQIQEIKQGEISMNEQVDAGLQSVEAVESSLLSQSGNLFRGINVADDNMDYHQVSYNVLTVV